MFKLSRWFTFNTFFGNKTENSLEIYLNYKDSKLTFSLFNTKLYKFELEEYEYQRFMLNLKEHIYHNNKMTFNNFLGI